MIVAFRAWGLTKSRPVIAGLWFGLDEMPTPGVRLKPQAAENPTRRFRYLLVMLNLP